MVLTGCQLGRAALDALRLRFFVHGPAAGEGEGQGLGGQGGQPQPEVTHVVVVDPDTTQGLQLAAAALQHRSPKGRVGLVVHAATPGQQLAPVTQLLLAAATGGIEASAADLQGLLATILEQPGAPAQVTAQQVEDWLPGGGTSAALELLAPGLPALAAAHAAFVRQGLRLPPGSNAVVSNGRIVEVEAGEQLVPEDFALMELYAEQHQFAKQLSAVVEEAVAAGAVGVGPAAAAVQMAASSVLAAASADEVDPRSGRISSTLASWQGQPNEVALQPRGSPAEEAPLLLQAVLDPLSKAAQRLAPLLRFLRQAFDPELRVGGFWGLGGRVSGWGHLLVGASGQWVGGCSGAGLACLLRQFTA